MRRWLDVLAPVAFFVPALPSHAIDPGSAQGFVRMGSTTAPMAHAYAYLHEPPKRPKELRVAIVDREVPQESLAGIAALPIEQLAREDKVRGILVRFDPSIRSKVLVTVLESPRAQGQALVSFSQGPVENFAMGNNRVLGDLNRRAEPAGGPDVAYRVQFSAPLFRGH